MGSDAGAMNFANNLISSMMMLTIEIMLIGCDKILSRGSQSLRATRYRSIKHRERLVVTIRSHSTMKSLYSWLLLCMLGLSLSSCGLCDVFYRKEVTVPLDTNEPLWTSSVYVDSLVRERELVLAVEECPDDSDVYCCRRDGTDNAKFCKVVEFDTVCWNIWDSYRKGLFFDAGLHSPEGDSLVDDMLMKANKVYSDLLMSGGGRSNVVWIEDERFKKNLLQGRERTQYRMQFEKHMYRLYRTRIRYMQSGRIKLGIWNFNARYGWQTSVMVPTNIYSIVEFKFIEPYVPENDFCYSFE